LESKKFSERAKALDVDQVAVYVASADLPFADLPFALSRWCGAEGVDNLTMVSYHRSMDLANRRGLRIKEVHLLARAVYVLDRDDRVVYREIVADVSHEPAYDAALNAVAQAVG